MDKLTEKLLKILREHPSLEELYYKVPGFCFRAKKRNYFRAKKRKKRTLTSKILYSLFVGCFKPTVKEGDEVEEGQKIGVVESLGVESEITSPQKAKILEIFVETDTAVEYKQPLFKIHPF